MDKPNYVRKTMLIIFCCLIISATAAMGQKPVGDTSYTPMGWKAVLAAAEKNPASKALHERLKNASSNRHDQIMWEAVDEALRTGDRSIVPYLIAKRMESYNPVNEIDFMLLKLGETQYIVQRAIDEVESEKTEYFFKIVAIRKLARFKTKEAYRKLYELLDDERNFDEHPNVEKDYEVPTLSEITKNELSNTVDDPPERKSEQGWSGTSTQEWKEWFKKHNLIDQP